MSAESVTPLAELRRYNALAQTRARAMRWLRALMHFRVEADIIDDLTAHEFKVGLRYSFGGGSSLALIK